MYMMKSNGSSKHNTSSSNKDKRIVNRSKLYCPSHYNDIKKHTFINDKKH